MAKNQPKKFKIRFLPKNKVVDITKLPFLNLIYLSILINVGVIIAVLFLGNFIPPKVPLFYGLPEGENQLGTGYQLIIPSMVSLLVILINISLASLLANDFLKRSLIIVSLIISLLSLITTLEIVFLVGNF
jgi:hypothetical protein